MERWLHNLPQLYGVVEVLETLDSRFCGASSLFERLEAVIM